MPATHKVANTIQPGEYSMGSGADDTSHKGSVAEVDGNRNVPYLNRNDSKRNLDLNWFDNDWNPIYRFLAVRYFHDFSRYSTGGSFVYQLFAPSAEHPPDFRKVLGEAGVLFRIKSLHLPCQLQEQFQKVDAGDASIDEHNFFSMNAITGEEAVLDRMEKYIINFRPECESVRFRKVS